jgi:uncharacterized protein (DUF983 family)
MASPVSAGFHCRCPHCGRGRLFSGYLKVIAKCEACGFELGALDTGDGPAVFVMFVVLVITMPLVFFVWAMFEPPIWVHAVLWPVVVTGLSLWLLPPAKGIMLALQYKHRPGEQ